MKGWFKMYKYYTFTDSLKVDCYLELDEDFNCERALYISNEYKVRGDYSYYYEGDDYVMPINSLENKIKSMNEISKIDFETQWLKEYTGNDEIKTLMKYLNFKRET